MRKLWLLAGCAALAACQREAAPADGVADTNMPMDADMVAPAAAMSLLKTTWEFSDDGTPMVISVDQLGTYIEEVRGGKHVDHGTYAQKNGEDCFTSAMGDGGTNCWTAVPPVEIGGTASATADDGQSGVFKRVEYRALKLPG